MAAADTSQWPLTAAATQTLLALPPSSAPKGAKRPKPKDAVKLALKELILRGAFRIQIEKRRMRKDKVVLCRAMPPAFRRPSPCSTSTCAATPRTRSAWS